VIFSKKKARLDEFTFLKNSIFYHIFKENVTNFVEKKSLMIPWGSGSKKMKKKL
jgi:hypothetical protein